jgi:hypothetical protein
MFCANFKLSIEFRFICGIKKTILFTLDYFIQCYTMYSINNVVFLIEVTSEIVFPVNQQ